MTNDLQLLLKTPRPNLAWGMQAFLSGYAQWWGRRRRRSGHLFQVRHRAEMIEDESFYWPVSRYIHLNSERAGLVVHPENWEWSSFPGYVAPARRRTWVAHDTLLAAWRGEHGGSDPAPAYRLSTRAGKSQPPPSPFRQAFGGWALRSPCFVDRLRCVARVELPGKGVSRTAEASAGTKKAARQMAAVRLLAAVVGRCPVPEPAPAPIEASPEPPVRLLAPDPGGDPVGALNEWAVARGLPPPCYEFTSSGPHHAPEFGCLARGFDREASGTGPAKQAAKAEVARALHALLAGQGPGGEATRLSRIARSKGVHAASWSSGVSLAEGPYGPGGPWARPVFTIVSTPLLPRAR